MGYTYVCIDITLLVDTSVGGLYLRLYCHHFTGRYLCWWAIPTFVLTSLYWYIPQLVSYTYVCIDIVERIHYFLQNKVCPCPRKGMCIYVGHFLDRKEATEPRVPLRHHNLVDRYGISVSQMTTDMFHLSLTLPGLFLIHDLSPGF